jgi:hypothetical protein
MKISRSLSVLLFIALGAVMFFAIKTSGLGKSAETIGLFILGGAAVLLSRLFRRRVGGRLPWISDEEFLTTFVTEPGLRAKSLIQGREWIASHFGVAPQRLAPGRRLGDLAKEIDLWGRAYIGLSDIEIEMVELWRASGQEPKPIGQLTVAEMASDLVRCGLFSDKN